VDDASSDGASSDGASSDASDPVTETLRAAQRGRSSRAQRRRQEPARPGNAGGYSGAWPDPTDPQRLGDVTEQYVTERGWQRPLSEARLFSEWAAIVGTDVAAHCRPSGLRDGELRISAESTAWATQLRLLGARLLARIVAETGPEIVTRVVVTGPVGPSWKHGPRSVRGARGPRDTYG
jgi:predicted nucleic acid-binding Zn ribbon protein